MNKYNPKKHHRRSIRLKGYDYSQAGFYFVTFCVQNRECLFGDITDGLMKLNDAGKMVNNEWLKLTSRFHNIALHEFVVMPNHFHAILEIVPVGATLVVAQSQGEGEGQPQGIAPTIAPTIAPAPTKTVASTPTKTPTPTKTLGDMVGAFESIVTVEYIRGVKNSNWQRFEGKLWQRNYWEHIIRNENEYKRIAQYIINNPQKWEDDKLNGGSGNIVMESAAPYGEEKWMI